MTLGLGYDDKFEQMIKMKGISVEKSVTIYKDELYPVYGVDEEPCQGQRCIKVPVLLIEAESAAYKVWEDAQEELSHYYKEQEGVKPI